MTPLSNYFKKKKIYNLPSILLILLTIVGCQFLSSSLIIDYKEKRVLNEDLKEIETIYIKAFKGTNEKEYEAFLFDSLNKQGLYNTTQNFPNERKHVAILEAEIEEYNSWEDEETSFGVDPLAIIDGEEENPLIRRNVTIAIKMTVKDGLTNELLISKKQYQSYQQVFLNKEALKKAPDLNKEMQRITRLAIVKLVEYLNYSPKNKKLYLEKGENPEEFSFFLYHESLMEKGIRFAHGKKFDQAASLWKLVLYEPVANEEEDPTGLYDQNKASAFYNIGQIRIIQEKWKEAASMFSRANRLVQKVKYAQAWADSIQKWVDVWRLLKEENQELPDLEDEPIIKELDIETIEELLLDEKKLWPLLNFEELEEVEREKEETEEKERELYEDQVGEPLIKKEKSYDLSPSNLD